VLEFSHHTYVDGSPAYLAGTSGERWLCTNHPGTVGNSIWQQARSSLSRRYNSSQIWFVWKQSFHDQSSFWKPSRVVDLLRMEAIRFSRIGHRCGCRLLLSWRHDLSTRTSRQDPKMKRSSSAKQDRCSSAVGLVSPAGAMEARITSHCCCCCCCCDRARAAPLSLSSVAMCVDGRVKTEEPFALARRPASQATGYVV